MGNKKPTNLVEKNSGTTIPKQETPHINIEGKDSSVNQLKTDKLSGNVPSSVVTNDGSIYFEKNKSVETFINKIGDFARKLGKDNDLYASVMIAQAILESGSGNSILSQAPYYNLFGIKGNKQNETVLMNTQEDNGNGNLYNIQSGFRVYKNYEESLKDYVKLLKEGITDNYNFYSGAWKSNAKTYQAATKFLTGRYATDILYNKKLDGLIETYDLTKYDEEVAGPKLVEKNYTSPLAHYIVSSEFGSRWGDFHRGIDLAASQGEPITASQSGIVIKAECHPSWGNYVVISHADGTNTLYAHQQEYSVRAGEHVKQGQLIGYVGSTGNSTGSHLHFEVCSDSSLLKSKLIDPRTIITFK